MPLIHPSAMVDPAAALAEDVEVGPYCIIGPNVTLGAGCRLIAHVHIAGHTTVGGGAVIHPFASLGGAPQSKAYRGESTRLEIGADCVIREGVTMNIGTVAGGGLTKVGDRGFYMANAHVGHDCRVGDDVVFANSATLGGHCTIGDHVFIGGLSAVHQHCRVGESAMISGLTGVRTDVIPFGLAIDAVGYLGGLNVVGMKRRELSRQSIATVRRAYRMLFLDDGVFADRVDAVADRYGGEPAVAKIVEFVRAVADRSLCMPRGRR
jgi:UDP-N-acetylglucosamine acyltransferase